MNYHFVVNGYQQNWPDKLQEMHAFQTNHLKEMKEATAYIYCDKDQRERIRRQHISARVVLLTAQEYDAESILEQLSGSMNPEDIYIFGSDDTGDELAVRSAARRGGSSVTDIISLDAQKRVIATKMVYSNHMEGSFLMKKGPFCVSLAKGQERRSFSPGYTDICEECVLQKTERTSQILGFEKNIEEDGLEDAGLVIVAGRGVKSIENVQFLKEVAKELGGELGITRPAAMNAWESMNRMIGVSAAMLTPDICITAGVSGAAAFYAGIEKSKCIIAINTDEKAPIMKKADVVIVDDFYSVMSALQQLIQNI